MFIVGFFVWWYGKGWMRQMQQARERIASFFDYFSIDLLLSTFFSPFRQISAGSVSGPIALQIRAFFDQLISRIIGSIVRMLTITIGIVTIAATIILEIIKLIAWAFVPIMPLIGLVLMLMKWVPWAA